MKYAIYMRKPNSTKAFKRHCEIRKNCKGLLTQYPINYYTFGSAKFDADILEKLGYEVKISELK